MRLNPFARRVARFPSVTSELFRRLYGVFVTCHPSAIFSVSFGMIDRRVDDSSARENLDDARGLPRKGYPTR